MGKGWELPEGARGAGAELEEILAPHTEHSVLSPSGTSVCGEIREVTKA